MTSFSKLIAALTDSRVRFVLIGGVALIARGGARVTNDLDLVYDRATDNLENLVSALGPLHPRLRGAPPDLPFLFDTRTLTTARADSGQPARRRLRFAFFLPRARFAGGAATDSPRTRTAPAGVSDAR